MRIFVTGASGWIGSAVVPDLLGAGHEVVGLARSDASADALVTAGATVQRGTVDDLDTLAQAAAACDGVVHLAFKHEEAFAQGDFAGAADADRRAVETMGDALAGSGRPFVLASGTLGVCPGQVATEADGLEPDPTSAALGAGPLTRRGTALVTLALAARDVRSSVVRLPPTCHGDGDRGFIKTIVETARAKGVSGYVGDGSQRWPAGHRFDVARLFCLAVEGAPPGAMLHASVEEGVRIRDVAEVIGRHLEAPVVSIDPDQALEHFGFLGMFLGLDSPASSERTSKLLGWQPHQVGLLEDLDQGHYFANP